MTQVETGKHQSKGLKLLSKVIQRVEEKRNLAIISVASALIALNVLFFVMAYPSIFVPKAANYASDFSAYYIAAWRLFHAPAEIYVGTSVPGEYVILPHSAAFKYLPSFLFLAAPLILTNYQSSFVLFDIFQLALLPLMAFLIYKLLEGRSALLISVVFFFVLLQPFVPSYFWQWSQGQDKVLQTFLIVLSFYLGKKGQPYLSGIVFGLSFFDPRFALIAIPLFALYNRGRIALASMATAVTFVLSNCLILFLFPGVFQSFESMVFNYGLSTPVYVYSFIPIITVAVLTIVNWKGFLSWGKELVPKKLLATA